MTVGILISLASAHAAGPCPSSYDDLMAEADGTLAAFEAGLFQNAQMAAVEVEVLLPCLVGVLEPQDVEVLYLATLLGRWMGRDLDGAAAAMGSLKAIHPDFDLGTELALVDPALLTWSESIAPGRAAGQTVPLPIVPWSVWRAEGVDGIQESPVGRPLVLQLVDTRSGELQTWWLEAGGVPPGIEAPDSVKGARRSSQAQAPRAARTPRERALREPTPTRSRVSQAGLWCLAGGAGLGTVTFIAGLARAPMYWDEAVFWKTANTAAWGVALGGGVAFALGRSERFHTLSIGVAPAGVWLGGRW